MITIYKKQLTVGIVGIGMIGGSLAKSIGMVNARRTSLGAGDDTFTYRILCMDELDTEADIAVMDGTCDDYLTEENIPECDYILIATYPRGVTEFVEKYAGIIKKGAVVMDMCGIKEKICNSCFSIARIHGFHFVGGHPMSGNELQGFENSEYDMFEGKTMFVVPDENEGPLVLRKVEAFMEDIGFENIVQVPAKEHDKVIALTSQLVHILSNAYIKLSAGKDTKPYEGGSYRDMARVGDLNVELWSEIFAENSENLVEEIDELAASLKEYRNAIKDKDIERLQKMLKIPKRKK